MYNVWPQVLILLGLWSFNLLLADTAHDLHGGFRSCLWITLVYSVLWFLGRWWGKRQ